MTTFGMLLLTLFTVLGSTILGWFLRRYMLGDHAGQPLSDDMLTRTKGPAGLAEAGGAHAADGPASMRYATGAAQKTDASGIKMRGVTGAIGTVAAGTAAVHYAGEDEVSEPDDASSRDHNAAPRADGTDAAGLGAQKFVGGSGGVAAESGHATTLGDSSASDRGSETLRAIPVESTEQTTSASGSSHAAVGVDQTENAQLTGVATAKASAPESAASDAGRATMIDEADSVFGKRGEVKDAHDRHANMDASHLLSNAESQRDVTPLAGLSTSELKAESHSPSDSAASGKEAAKASASLRSGSAGKSVAVSADPGGTDESSVLARGTDTDAARDGQVVSGAKLSGDAGSGATGTTRLETGESVESGISTHGRGAETSTSDAGVVAAKASEAASARDSGSAGTDQAGANSDTSGSSLAGASSSDRSGAATQTGASQESDDADAAKQDELEASRAEVRQLRGRLDLEVEEGVADDTSRSIDARLAASREDARALRQQLWSRQALADAAAAESKASDASGGAADFGALSANEIKAQSLLSSGALPTALSGKLEAPTPGFDPDDLTKISGIGKPTQGRLNRSGVYYYDQIAKFSAADIAWMDNELNLDGRVVSDRWIPQAQHLAGDGNAAKTNTAGSGVATGPAPTSLLDKPITGRAPDDLTAIKGVGAKLQDQLNGHGVYYYSQIADFSAADQAWASETLGFPGRVERDEWLPQARALMANPPSVEAEGRAARVGVLAAAGKQLGSMDNADAPGAMSHDETEAMKLIESGEFVADESNRPDVLLKSATGGAKDDLKLIKGVGPKLEDLLNGLGIYYFRQIGAFSATDIAWVDSKLRFRGRIVRDRWVDQAKRLR